MRATHSRPYVVSVKPPLVYSHKPVPRVYATRKAYLYNQYTSLLQSCSSSPLLFLQHTNFSIPGLIKLRREIGAASTASIRNAPSLSSLSPARATTSTALPELTIMRTAIFGVALRDFAPLDAKTSEEIAGIVTGGLAVLTLPSLDPPELQAILRALSRAVPPKKAQSRPDTGKDDRVDEADVPTPGRRQKRMRRVLTPELSLLGALIEGRVFRTEGVQDVAKLPTLDKLRAQIVGLISSPATQLAAMLSEASGGRLARTLDGFKQGLEEGGADSSVTFQ